jgi:hypothetical protein
VAGTLQQRLAVADRINAVRYKEYADGRAGWLKAVPFAGMVRYDRAEQSVVHLWHVARDERVCVEALDTILDNDMTWSVPESVGTPGLEWGKWEPVTELHARRIVDAIVAGSSPESPASAPYAQLRAWFFDELFDTDVRFFAPANGPPYDLNHPPAVAGIDHDVVALFWLR